MQIGLFIAAEVRSLNNPWIVKFTANVMRNVNNVIDANNVSNVRNVRNVSNAAIELCLLDWN